MCGIAGEISWSDQKEEIEVYEKIKNTLKRRGPDEDGIYRDQNAVLIHARLSVIDIEHGKQPMSFAIGEEKYALVYNGELYNTDEIRKELIDKGYSFEGHSDTEVVLKAYIEWKEKCVDRFNGIFAFAVWEAHQKRLFLARDRMGVKPLFYAQIGGRLLFSSEIKGILAHPLCPARIDVQSICEVMLVGPGRTPGYGVFKNIREIRPASYAYYSKDGLKVNRYWKLTDGEHNDTFEETVEKIRYLVKDAITRQLVSDVPICTFLSGGLDSSVISSIAKTVLNGQGKELHTFSVDYQDNDRYFKASKFQPNSDNAYIEKMNRYLGVQNHRVVLDTPDLVKALFSAVDARDLPGMADVDSSLLLFCKEIKKDFTVALSGECADEIFGGYPWYRDKTIRETDGFPWAQSTTYRASFMKNEFLDGVYPLDYVHDKYLNTVEDTDNNPENSPLESRMKEMMRLNTDWFMQTLLDRKDRCSMYQGLEVRVPFCDYRIAEYLYRVPWEFKNYHDHEKGLLRKAMEGILPEEVLWRKKSPYPKTHNPSYQKAVSALLTELLADQSAPIWQIVKREPVMTLLTSDNPVPWYGQLMTTPQTMAYLLQINYWLKTYHISII